MKKQSEMRLTLQVDLSPDGLEITHNEVYLKDTTKVKPSEYVMLLGVAGAAIRGKLDAIKQGMAEAGYTDEDLNTSFSNAMSIAYEHMQGENAKEPIVANANTDDPEGQPGEEPPPSAPLAVPSTELWTPGNS